MRILFIPLMFLVACQPEITKEQFDQALKAQQQKMEKQNKAIKRVVRTQGDTIRQLKALLAEPLVNGVVSNLAAASKGAVAVSTVTVASNSGKKVAISGHAKNKKRLASFVSALEKHAMIEKVYLANVTPAVVAGQERQAFSITAKYVAAPTKKKKSVDSKKSAAKKKDALKKKTAAKNKKVSPTKGKKPAPAKKPATQNK